MLKLTIVILWMSLILSQALAQTNTKIIGQVQDKNTSSPIAGVTVAIIGTSFVTNTNDRGYFYFENLPSGEYQLEIRSLGYEPAKSDAIQVTEDNTIFLTIQLLRKPISLPEIVVTGQPDESELSSSQSIILNQEQIRRLPANTLSEVLNSVPGVYVQQAGPNVPARISIRGSATDQVLVLLNGVRLNSAQTGEADLNAVPLSQVSRIEIIKGAQTGRYGADALAGVINIITSATSAVKSTEVKSKMSNGSFGYQSWELSSQKSLTEEFKLSSSLSNGSSGGDFTYSDSGKIMTRANSGQVSENAFMSLAWQPADRVQALLSLFKYFARNELPGPLLQLNDSAYSKDRRFNLTFNSSLKLSSAFSLESKAGYQDWRQTYHIQEPFYIPVDVDYTNRNWEGENRLDFARGSNKISYGLSYLYSVLKGDDHQRPSLSLGTVSRSTFSTFVSGQKSIRKMFSDLILLTASVRFDKTSGFQPNWSPLFGVLLTKGQKLNFSLKANWGKSYHNPTLNALFWKEDAYSVGNPNLKPERAANFDAGAEFRLPLLGEFTLGQTYFHNNVRDLIVWQRGFDGKYSPFNVSKVRIEGYEQTMLWRSSGDLLELEFNHTRSDAVNLTESHTQHGNLIPFRPRHQYNFKCYFKSEKFDLNLHSRYASRRYTREQNTTGKELPSYTIWDLILKFKHSLHGVELDLTVGIYNFTDQNYELIERYPMPGREFRLTTQLTL
jgi:outer membrane cobalamin receptor